MTVHCYSALYRLQTCCIALAALLIFAVPGRTQPRQVIDLNGSWDIAQGTMNAIPQRFSRRVPVPGLVDMAEPAYAEVGKKPVVKTPDEVVSLVRGRLKGKKKEYFLALLLDTRNQLIKVSEISVGSLDASVVHPREVFKEAISASAASVIFVHNHPSGDPEASEDDIKLNRRLAEAGGIMGIDVLDHIIIGDENYLSLKRQGLF